MMAPSVAKAPSYIDPFCCCECDRECAAVSYNKYLFKSTEFDDPLTIFSRTPRALRLYVSFERGATVICILTTST